MVCSGRTRVRFRGWQDSFCSPQFDEMNSLEEDALTRWRYEDGVDVCGVLV